MGEHYPAHQLGNSLKTTADCESESCWQWERRLTIYEEKLIGSDGSRDTDADISSAHTAESYTASGPSDSKNCSALPLVGHESTWAMCLDCRGWRRTH